MADCELGKTVVYSVNVVVLWTRMVVEGSEVVELGSADEEVYVELLEKLD